MTTTPTDRARSAMGMPAADPPPATAGKAVSLVERRIAVVRDMREQFEMAVPPGVDVDQLIRDGATALRTTPGLIETTQQSFLGALMTCAQLGLRPNIPTLGHGWILPFKDRASNTTLATWIVGYKGMIELSYQTELVAAVNAHTIYSNEPHRIVYGTDERIEHEPIFDDSRGTPVKWYACVWFTNGGYTFRAYGKPDIERIRLKSKQAEKGPWRDDYDEMAKKSCLRALWKYMPKGSRLALAAATDDTVRTDLDPAAVEHLTQVNTVGDDEAPPPPDDEQ